MDSNRKIFTVGSLFSGIGGFCRAFHKEGFRIIWANDYDRATCKTYRLNFPEVNLYEKPIEKLSIAGDNIAEIDVLTAGFPCQPFSVAGEKRGFDDPRGRAFFEIIRLLKEFGNARPKIVVLENVYHILKHDGGRTFAKIVDKLQGAGYWFSRNNVEILDTARHTRIPQIRQRLFMIGLSTSHFDCNEFRFPPEDPMVDDFRSYLELDKKQDEWHYFSQESRWGILFHEAIKKGNPDAVYQLRRYYVREIKNKCIPTLTANMGEGGHNQPVIKDRWGIRKITVHECLKLQGFIVDNSDKFIFPDDVTIYQQYKQIGNSVTVPLIRRIAKECVNILGQNINLQANIIGVQDVKHRLEFS